MSNPNPLVPQGSLLEQQARSKSTFQMAAFIVALHVVVLGGFLFLGCKKEESQVPPPAIDTFAAPPPVLTDTISLAPLDPSAVPSAATESILPPVTNPTSPPVTQLGHQPSIPPPYVATPTQPSPVAGTEHVIQKGEIAFVLARKNGLSLKQLQEANPGKDLAKLKVGGKLVIPSASSVSTPVLSSFNEGGAASASSYTVKGGDNLSRLAKKFGITVKAIRDANGMNSNDIRVGQKLKIPGKSSASASDTAPPPVPSSTLIPPPTVIPGNAVLPPPQ